MEHKCELKGRQNIFLVAVPGEVVYLDVVHSFIHLLVHLVIYIQELTVKRKRLKADK